MMQGEHARKGTTYCNVLWINILVRRIRRLLGYHRKLHRHILVLAHFILGSMYCSIGMPFVIARKIQIERWVWYISVHITHFGFVMYFRKYVSLNNAISSYFVLERTMFDFQREEKLYFSK